MHRSDSPYADLYEASVELSAVALAAAYWALNIMWDRKAAGLGFDDIAPVLRSAMHVRRTQRAARYRILAESFRREVCDGAP